MPLQSLISSYFLFKIFNLSANNGFKIRPDFIAPNDAIIISELKS
jgi:hypothetical protein